jgi:hypothetical protein
MITPKFTPDRRILPFRKTVPQPINPYSQATVREYLRMPFARSAWIVPVRGVLPWQGCSSAITLASSPSENPSFLVPPQPEAENREIIWTHASLIDFWGFLLAVREANTLGPLALSFHASVSNNPRPLLLLEVDHIKIYHDAVCAMLIRSVLDAWAYPTAQVNRDRNADNAAPDNRTRTNKVRVLKGTKLVLLDERSNGVLVS